MYQKQLRICVFLSAALLRHRTTTHVQFHNGTVAQVKQMTSALEQLPPLTVFGVQIQEGFGPRKQRVYHRRIYSSQIWKQIKALLRTTTKQLA
jgi:hypothetical protein